MQFLQFYCNECGCDHKNQSRNHRFHQKDTDQKTVGSRGGGFLNNWECEIWNLELGRAGTRDQMVGGTPPGCPTFFPGSTRALACGGWRPADPFLLWQNPRDCASCKGTKSNVWCRAGNRSGAKKSDGCGEPSLPVFRFFGGPPKTAPGPGALPGRMSPRIAGFLSVGSVEKMNWRLQKKDPAGTPKNRRGIF